jgi:DNA-binding transcriptional LysR family regulator
MGTLTQALAGFQAHFPSVQTRVHVETLGAAVQALLDSAVDLGLVTEFASAFPELERTGLGEVELVPVAAPGHPLALADDVLESEALRDHIQLVLADRSALTAGKDHGVAALRTWRIADLGAKHAMLLAGLGWGSMPLHMVSDDLDAARLVQLKVRSWDGADRMPRLPIVVAHRRDRPLGPAGRWLLARLAERS